MTNSVYVTISKQAAAGRNMAVIANNLANANSVGYKAETMVFDSYLVDDANNRKTAYAQDKFTIRDNSQGRLEMTGNPLDFAINGPGYFMVQTENGERFTRAGNFLIDTEGSLATQDGYKVLDDGGGQIDFEETDQDIVVFGDGRMEVDGEERGTIGIYQFTDLENSLTRLPGGLFETDQAPLPNDGLAQMAQGMVERSNVEPIVQITNMIDVQRDFTRSAKFVSNMYEIQENAIRTISRQT